MDSNLAHISYCINKLDSLKKLHNYGLEWDHTEGNVIDTTLPVLKRSDTDGLPLMFGVSFYDCNFNMVFTPWLIGQPPHTLESLYISRKSDAESPYSHTGNTGDSEIRLEMMMFKPKHKDRITTQTFTGAITGHVFDSPVKNLYHLYYPLICLPDHKKKTIIIRPCQLDAENDTVNVKHIAKYIIDPSNKVIRWIFPQTPVYETVKENDDGIKAEMYKRGFSKLDEQCWLTKKSLLFIQSIINNDRLVQFSDFTLKEINRNEKFQMIETSLPCNGDNVYPLIFGVWNKNTYFGKKYDILLRDDSKNLHHRSPGINRGVNITSGIFFSKFETSDETEYCEPIIYIPDYGKGVLYYVTDRTQTHGIQKKRDIVHYMIKYLVDWSFSKKAWWIIPDFDDFYEDVTGVKVDLNSNVLNKFIRSTHI